MGVMTSEEWGGGDGVYGRGNLHSTPFVFLMDAFTGEFLCVCDLGRGHFFRNQISQLAPFSFPFDAAIFPHIWA
jgi:hypothetical protein